MTFRMTTVVLTIFVLQIVTVVTVPSPIVALAISPSFNHQEIENSPKWMLVNGKERAEDIHDGRKIFFNNSPKLSQCTDISLFKKLPNITSVSYSSDGNILNTTFWLSQRPLVNDYYQNSERASEIRQVSVHLYVEEMATSQYRTLNETIAAEERFLREHYHDVSNTEITTNRTTKLGSNDAAEIEFTGNLNYTTLGHPEVRGKDTFMTKGNKLIRILYLAEPDDYLNQLPNITEMLRSFRTSNDTKIEGNNPQAPGDINITSAGTVPDKNTNFKNYSTDGVTISYPSDWGIIEGVNPKATFFSPVKGPLLTGLGYIVSLDVPSVYEADTDFVAKVTWSDRLYNRTWVNLLEETSLAGTTRTLQEIPNFTDSFEEQKNYARPKPHALVPIDLGLANSPTQYLMVFITESRIIRNGFLCDLIQKTGQVSAPPPKFIISPSVNSTSIGPRETETIEVKVTSLSDIPYTIFLKPDSSKYMDATFSPSKINVPPSGWANSRLTIKSNGTTALDSTVTETLRIVVQPEQLAEVGNRIAFNTNRSVETSPAPIPNIYSIGLTITVFNSVDNALHVLSSISTPVSVAVALAGVIGGGIGWLLQRTKKQQGNNGN